MRPLFLRHSFRFFSEIWFALAKLKFIFQLNLSLRRNFAIRWAGKSTIRSSPMPSFQKLIHPGKFYLHTHTHTHTHRYIYIYIYTYNKANYYWVQIDKYLHVKSCYKNKNNKNQNYKEILILFCHQLAVHVIPLLFIV